MSGESEFHLDPETAKVFGAILMGSRRWAAFDESVRIGNRHHGSDPDYFKELMLRCRERETTLQRGEAFYRARVMPFMDQTDKPLPMSEMGAPPAHLCNGARLNPPGIVYLYLASTEGTAIAEIRPWRGVRVSVATVALEDDVRVIDLRTRREGATYLDPSHWLSLNLARPVHRDDAYGYVTTQLVSETLKAEGYDGILYDSSLEPKGFNIAMFNSNIARVKGVDLYTVYDIEISSHLVEQVPDLRQVPAPPI